MAPSFEERSILGVVESSPCQSRPTPSAPTPVAVSSPALFSANIPESREKQYCYANLCCRLSDVVEVLSPVRPYPFKLWKSGLSAPPVHQKESSQVSIFNLQALGRQLYMDL
ncbi:hypothetical protein MRX96_042123 [Rhipicephalus microplus]